MKLEAAKGGQYDLILASDYIIETAIQKGIGGQSWTPSRSPNFQNINPAFQSKYYDPTNEYTVPLCRWHPADHLQPLNWWILRSRALRTQWNPQLADSIVGDGRRRNVIGSTLKSMGYSLNETDEAVLGQARRS